MLVTVTSPPDAGRSSASARVRQAAASVVRLICAATLCAVAAAPLAAQSASAAHKKRSASSKASSASTKASKTSKTARKAKSGATATRSRATRSAATRPAASSSTASEAAEPVAAGRDSALRAFQVDTVAEPIPETLAPRYPRELRSREVRGSVVAEFVVDTAGRVEPGTFRVITSDDPAFTTSVRELLPRARFLPAINEGRLVRQTVRQTFVFDLDVLQRPGAAAGAASTPPTTP